MLRTLGKTSWELSMDTNFWLLIAVLVLVFFSLFKGSAGEPPRLRSIDQKLDLILTQLGIDPNEGLDAQLKELAHSGRKIEAIKLYRQQTGVGLKEAKDHIESHYGA
jgi:hypothetical protein